MTTNTMKNVYERFIFFSKNKGKEVSQNRNEMLTNKGFQVDAICLALSLQIQSGKRDYIVKRRILSGRFDSLFEWNVFISAVADF